MSFSLLLLIYIFVIRRHLPLFCNQTLVLNAIEFSRFSGTDKIESEQMLAELQRTHSRKFRPESQATDVIMSSFIFLFFFLRSSQSSIDFWGGASAWAANKKDS